jgi:hypothetical protein
MRNARGSQDAGTCDPSRGGAHWRLRLGFWAYLSFFFFLGLSPRLLFAFVRMCIALSDFHGTTPRALFRVQSSDRVGRTAPFSGRRHLDQSYIIFPLLEVNPPIKQRVDQREIRVFRCFFFFFLLFLPFGFLCFFFLGAVWVSISSSG